MLEGANILVPAGRQDKNPKPGDRNPDSTKEIWALCTSGDKCPEYPAGRYVKTTTPLKLEAAGFRRRCLTCAQRARWSRPGHRHPRLRDGKMPFLDGSTAFLSQPPRTEEHIKNRVTPIACGVCGSVHTAGITAGKGSNGICEDCLPLLVLVMRREQYTVESAERDRVYAKIRRIRKALDADELAPHGGPQIPFWSLARAWAAWYRRKNKAASWGVYLAHYRHLILFFEDKPIGEIGGEELSGLERHLLETPGIHGMRSPVTAQKTKETLRRILSYAVKRGWLEANPVGGGLIARYVPLKSDRFVTVNEEDKLLAACDGEFSVLREPLIYLADTGAYDKHREQLAWPDVRFSEGLIRCSGGFFKMTPRLERTMRELWERSGRPAEGRVWPPRPRVRDLLPGLCEAAGVERLQLKAFRRTFPWRMKEIGMDSWVIADAMGLKDSGFIRAHFDVNLDLARRERESGRFLEFKVKELGGAAQIGNGNGNGLKNEAERKEFEEIVNHLLDIMPQHRIRRHHIAREYDRRRDTKEALDPTTITKLVQRCYTKQTTVEDAVALVAEKRKNGG